MISSHRPLVRLGLAVALLCSTLARAEDSAAELSRKSREKGALNLVGVVAQLRLVTTSAEGQVKDQRLSTTSRGIAGKTHALARFSAPASVAGVAILTVEGGKGQPDEVALYLPKLKRVRKVAKADRAKPFMDTDFSYADITSNGTPDDAAKRLADEQVEGRDCYVLEGRGDEGGPYGPVKLFIDQKTFVPLRVEYADPKGQPFKRYRTVKLKAFKDRVFAAEAVMENLQTGSKTALTILSLEDSTLGDDAFTEQALERG